MRERERERGLAFETGMGLLIILGFFIWRLWFYQHSRPPLNSAASGKSMERHTYTHLNTHTYRKQPLPFYMIQITDVEGFGFIKFS